MTPAHRYPIMLPSLYGLIGHPEKLREFKVSHPRIDPLAAKVLPQCLRMLRHFLQSAPIH